MKPVTYISGPISGHADGNRPAFDRAAEMLRDKGHEVRNPHEIFTEPPPADQSPEALLAYWRRAMRTDVKALMDCDFIALLPHWQASKGARWEYRIATEMLGMRPIFLD